MALTGGSVGPNDYADHVVGRTMKVTRVLGSGESSRLAWSGPPFLKRLRSTEVFPSQDRRWLLGPVHP